MDSTDLRGALIVDHRWYAIQTTAGHENKVRSLMQRRIEQDPRPAGGARDSAGAGSDAGSGRDQERQEGDRRAEDVPGVRARGDGDEPGDHSHGQRHPGRHQVRRARAARRSRCGRTRSIGCSGSRRMRSPRSRRKRFRSSSVRRWRSPKGRSRISTGRSKRSWRTRAKCGCRCRCSAGRRVWSWITCS